jgi:hypothetical protein
LLVHRRRMSRSRTEASKWTASAGSSMVIVLAASMA